MLTDFAPQPRFRLYTTSGSYSSFFNLLWTKCFGDPYQGVARLERALTDYFGVQNAICVSQNRIGVYLAIRALIQPGQAVIMSPYTIADITNMVICAGGRPLYADVERATCNISAEQVEMLMNPNVGAVLITHLHGLAAEAHKIKAICDRHNVPMIEDSAQGFGTRDNGRLVGTIGKAGIFSFGMYKNINTWLGGAVMTDDRLLAQKIRAELETFDQSPYPRLFFKLRSGLMTALVTSPLFFRLFTFWIFRYGFINDVEWINKKVRIELDVSPKKTLPDWYRSRYTSAQARLALRQLPQIDANAAERVKRGLLYHHGLKDIPELIIPPAREDLSHAYTYFPIQYPQRDELLKFMMRHNRDVAAQHYKNNADLEGFKEFYRDCPNARAVAQQLIFLPTYPSYAIDEVTKNIRVIREFFGRPA